MDLRVVSSRPGAGAPLPLRTINRLEEGDVRIEHHAEPAAATSLSAIAQPAAVPNALPGFDFAQLRMELHGVLDLLRGSAS